MLIIITLSSPPSHPYYRPQEEGNYRLLEYAIKDCELVLFFRSAIDDRSQDVLLPAILALHALIVDHRAELLRDRRFYHPLNNNYCFIIFYSCIEGRQDSNHNYIRNINDNNIQRVFQYRGMEEISLEAASVSIARQYSAEEEDGESTPTEKHLKVSSELFQSCSCSSS